MKTDFFSSKHYILLRNNVDQFVKLDLNLASTWAYNIIGTSDAGNGYDSQFECTCPKKMLPCPSCPRLVSCKAFSKPTFLTIDQLEVEKG